MIIVGMVMRLIIMISMMMILTMITGVAVANPLKDMPNSRIG